MTERDAAPELRAGDRLGPYEIEARLGAGGMGVVYRARDARLARTVAIKLLSGLDAAHGERRARFEREARAIAQLQHPNVCTLHDVGTESGRDYLVMELLDGETLERRLERGALPLAQAFAVGAAIAEALAAAHRRAILHRDLKPGNVMLTRGGPKLLDFGLAKLRSDAVGASADPAARTADALTTEGTLLGTLAYMAPEQLEGRPADERADLWALGCLLHEMATGERAFGAETPASTIAAILDREPRAVSELAALAPRSFDRLVHACLAKDPEARWRSAADLARELRWLAEGDAATPSAQRPARARLVWVAAGLGLLALGALAGSLGRSRAAGSTTGARPAVRALLPLEQPGVVPFTSVPALSPDGRWVVVSSVGSSGSAPLQLRALDGEGERPLAGTEGGAFAFWSPDSRSIGFFQGKRLKRLELEGGDARAICAIDDQARGGAWSPNGTIVFSGGRRGALSRVAATGGTPTPVTTLDAARGERTHRWPQFLPDGERFLYWAASNESDERPAIRLGALRGGDAPVIVERTTNGVYSTGHLLFTTWTDGLVAQRFDARSGKLSGARFPISREVFVGMGVSILPLSASDGGDLVYLTRPTTFSSVIGWYDRAGNPVGSVADPEPWGAARPSPDGRRLAVTLIDLKPERFRTDLWVFDLVTGHRSRLTFEEGDIDDPAWSPDGRRIAYVQYRDGKAAVRVRAAEGGAEELLLEEPALDDPSLDWSPDGSIIAYQVFDGERADYDLRALDPATKSWRELLATGADETSPRFSLDGRFLAYVSNESGTDQVYLRRLVDGEKWQVSVDGGHFPRWTRDGGEIVFLGGDHRLRAAAVRLGEPVTVGSPVLAPGARPFPVTSWFHLEPTPDGRLLADAPPPENLDAKLRLILNWPGLLPP